MSDKEYINELEKIVIFLCDVYVSGQDSLAVQEDSEGGVSDKWFGIFMHFPTIQGGMNRIFVRKISELRTIRGNREAIKMTFEELYERLEIGRRRAE